VNNASQRQRANAIVLIGVSGSGKTTVGTLLAKAMGCQFYDGDDFHSPENKAKMRHGVPLTEEDRWPWLAGLKHLITESLASGKTIVLACSALHKDYRMFLYRDGVRFVYLKGDFELFKKRIEGRKNHFFDPGLLPSQFNELEEPQMALTVDAAKTPEEIVREIQDRLELR
jgi:gluconokinase